MPNNQGVATASVPEVRTRLHEAARMLRDCAALDARVQSALAELLDELGQALEAPEAPPDEVARLAEGAAHLAEALHQGHDPRLLGTARDRLEGLVFQAEARAPVTVGLARRLIDALASLGI